MKRTFPALAALALLSMAQGARADFINGDFQTGSLTPWTVFTTANGTVGSPSVVSFDTTGSGASLAAQFNVGEASFDGTEQGGGIYQNVVLTAGLNTITGNFASFQPEPFQNSDAGTFSVLVDGVTEQSFALGTIDPSSTLRGSFDVNFTATAGSHQIEFLITRHFVGNFPSQTPNEYLDNLSVTPSVSTPEPATVTLLASGFLAAGGFHFVRRRRNAAVITSLS
jgi:hypothetical protein